MSLFHSAAVAAVAALGVFGAIQQYGFVRDNDQQYRDPFRVMEIQSNLAGVAPGLPVGTRISYFSDMPASETQARAAFFASRYGLAPRLLINDDSAPRYALGVFFRSQNAEQAAAGRGLDVVKVLGPGFVLFEKRGAK